MRRARRACAVVASERIKKIYSVRGANHKQKSFAWRKRTLAAHNWRQQQLIDAHWRRVEARGMKQQAAGEKRRQKRIAKMKQTEQQPDCNCWKSGCPRCYNFHPQGRQSQIYGSDIPVGF